MTTFQTSEKVPFAFSNIDETPLENRGYGTYPSEWDYDPVSQVSDLLFMGESSPTTHSSISSTAFGSDTDQGEDDTGKD